MDGTNEPNGTHGTHGTHGTNEEPPTPTSSRATTAAGMPSASSGNTITCPICREGLPTSSYLTHLSRRHPITLGWMIGLSVQQEALTEDVATEGTEGTEGLHLDTALLLGMQTGAMLGFWDLGPEHSALGQSGVYNFAPWIGGTLGREYGSDRNNGHNDDIFGPLDTMNEYATFGGYNAVTYDADTYEALQSICEEIGDHPTGVKNIDEVAPLIDKNETLLEGRCPICLDILADIVQERPVRQLRQIQQCKHVFCGPCLEQWFEAKRWCPLCKTEAEASASASA